MNKRLKTTFWIWSFAGTNLLWILLVVAAFFYRSVRDRRDYVNAPESNPQYEDRMNLFSLADQRRSGPVDVLFLGDSHTQRGLFSEFYPDLRVINRGIGSDTSDGVMKRLDEIVKLSPKKIVMLFGGNDRAFEATPEHVVQNMDAIVVRLKNELPNAKIAIVSLFPPKSDKKVEWVEKVNTGYRNISICNNIEYIDVFDDISRGGGANQRWSPS